MANPYMFRFEHPLPAAVAKIGAENGWTQYGAVAHRQGMGEPFDGAHARSLLAVLAAYQRGERSLDALRLVYETTR